MKFINRSLSKSETAFIDYLVDDMKGVDSEFRDIDRSNRQCRIKENVLIRRSTTPVLDGTSIPAILIVEQAADRYFDLLQVTRQSLNKKFSIGDLKTILNTECTPVWNYLPSHSIASMVADDNGIESLDELEDESSIKILLEKLIELNPAQNAALADICERIWRFKSGQSISELCEEMGMSLAE